MLVVECDSGWSVAAVSAPLAAAFGVTSDELAGQCLFAWLQRRQGNGGAERLAGLRDALQRVLLGRAATTVFWPALGNSLPNEQPWICWPLLADNGNIRHIVCQAPGNLLAANRTAAAQEVDGERILTLEREKQPAAGRGLTKLPQRRILVVDDTRDAATMLGRLLVALGQQVEIVYDGASALAAAERNKPDLVISDIAMPGMDGYELARQLRRSSTLSDLKLVALTGYGQERDRRQAFEAGFNRHLVKPITLECLKSVLCEMTDGGGPSC
jgi:CheY-like chemotaxis protein